MTEPTDPQDQPEDEGYSLVYPFTVVASKGGPYDDAAFVAGFQCGEIDRGLRVALVAGADRYSATVRTDLVGQLELIGMAHGWPVAHAVANEDYPEWTALTFMTAESREHPHVG